MHSLSTEIGAILREEIELAQKDDPGLIVRSAFDVIEYFLNQGMSLERIAAALQKHDIKVTKGHLVRHLGIVREERGLRPLKRGRKSAAPGLSVQSSATNGSQIPIPIPLNQAQDAPSPAKTDASISTTGLNQTDRVPTPPKAVAHRQERTDKHIGSAQQPVNLQRVIPEEITRLKFIEVDGELLDVTRMDIDDYLTVTKTLSPGQKIPQGMFEVIAAENRIRSMYERALLKYDEAIAIWKSRQ
jgi:hypothetical protein